MQWFWNFLKKLIIHFRMFLYLETFFLRVAVSLLCRLQEVPSYMFQFIPIKLVKGDEIVRPFDWTASKPWLSGNLLQNLKTCENWGEFSENLRIVQLKLVGITRFLSPKSTNLQLFTLILYCVGGQLWCWNL